LTAPALVRRGTDGTWTRYGLGRPPYLQVNEQFPSQSRPSIVADTGGTVHVICYGSVSGTQQILHGSFAPGENFSGWEVIAPSGGDQRHGALAVDRSGRLHVAWREGVQPGRNGGAVAAIFYSVRETDGRWRRPVRLTGDDEDASTPSVGVTDSTVSVAWIAWAPGTANSEGQVDNGFPADHSTVEGRVEVTSSPIGPTHFDAPAVIDPGPASYPCWAVTARAGDPRPPLAWTSRDVGSGAMSLKLGWCERGR